MKLAPISRAFLALAATALMSACGGGGGEQGDNFVSTTQFASGSVGFYLVGNGGVLSILSDGAKQGVSSDKPGGSIKEPDPVFDPLAEGAFDGDGMLGYVVPEGFEDFGVAEAVSPVCTGRMFSESGGSGSCRLSHIEYKVETGGRRAYMDIIASTSTDSTTADTVLAHFFGAVVRNDFPTTNSGNTGSMVWYDDQLKRVLLISSQGTSVHVWFNFDTNTCLVQLRGLIYTNVKFVDDNLVETGAETGMHVAEGAIFSGQNCTFRKLSN